MIVKRALDIISQESETMIIEWADTQDGFGVDKINYLLKTFFEKEEISIKDREKIVTQLKILIKLDMTINGW